MAQWRVAPVLETEVGLRNLGHQAGACATGPFFGTRLLLIKEPLLGAPYLFTLGCFRWDGRSNRPCAIWGP